MTKSVRMLSFDAVIDHLLALNKEYHQNYLAMYSSWYDGIVTDARLMMVPIDDHLVHRGDGVFEAIKCVGWNVYALERHLDRLERSAKASHLNFPFPRSKIKEIMLETLRAAGVSDALVRLFVSRGPGGFTTNPYESSESQLYIVVTHLERPPEEKYESGVTLKSSWVPIKKAYFANVKSCNYLPNVLMTKEAVDAGVDFTVSIDENNFLGEGPTENVGIITRLGEFLVPRFERILQGITVTRMLELAGQLVASGDLSRAAEADIARPQAYDAAEIMMFGTTFDILPVVDYDGKRVGSGRPGPMFKKFLRLLEEDVHHNPAMLTPVWK